MMEHSRGHQLAGKPRNPQGEPPIVPARPPPVIYRPPPEGTPPTVAASILESDEEDGKSELEGGAAKYTLPKGAPAHARLVNKHDNQAQTLRPLRLLEA